MYGVYRWDKDIRSRKIIENNLDPKIIASTTVDTYMKQVFEYGFFHADPHSGNIFILISGQIAFIDYGSVGRMLPTDKERLGDLVICILKRYKTIDSSSKKDCYKV